MMASRRFSTNDIYDGRNFNNLDDMQPPMRRFSPLELKSDRRLYQNYERRNDDRTPES